MKNMKRLATVLFAMLITLVSMAQTQDDVTLTVSGDGATKEEATNNALRSAIAQAYGVFVSANTQILNDEVVKDEIATVTSGNIKQYKEVACLDMPNGRKEVTVQATVSISKLISYAQSKGASAEFAGATFAKNLKFRQLNQDNEVKAVGDFIEQLQYILPTCYNRKLIVSEPTMQGQDVLIPMRIEYIPNENLDNLINAFKNVIGALSLSIDEIKEYQQLNIPVYCFYFVADGNKLLEPGSMDYDTSAGVFVLRNNYAGLRDVLRNLFDNYFLHFKINDNTGEQSEYEGTWNKQIEGRTWPFLSSDLDRVENKKTTGLFNLLESREGAYHEMKSMEIANMPFAISSWFEVNISSAMKTKKAFGKMLKAAIGNNAISEDMMSKVGGNIIYGGDGLELFWERQKGYSFSQRQKSYAGDSSSPSNSPVQGKKSTIIPSVNFVVAMPSSDIGKYNNFSLSED